MVRDKVPDLPLILYHTGRQGNLSLAYASQNNKETNMPKIKVIINGAKGKMGCETVSAVKADPALLLVGECDLGDDLTKAIKTNKAEVVVDFTTPKSAMENIRKIIGAGARAVVGTTGITEANLKEIKKLAKDSGLGVLIAPNFAIGAVLMMKYSKEIAAVMPKAEIIELHHDKKLDAPSGTAAKTAQMIKDVTGKDVPIHSVRLPGYVASQEVIFGGIGQTLIIRHDSISRESFMPGVVLACKKIVEINELVYGLEKVL
jgi:4-hydroxy-tetrahydrodipicolinate reductase